MNHYDTIVIGGGIVGLTVAWSLLERSPRSRIAVLEKEDCVACHQTGRNSGVIHSGIYYKPGSLKAELCRRGNHKLIKFCDDHGISYDICGKVIVATDDSENARMKSLFERGKANGLDVTELCPEQVREIEPHVACVAGIHVPSTGIVNFGEICCSLADLIQQRGGDLHLGVKVQQIRSDKGSTVFVETSEGDFETDRLINCAGLHSDRIAGKTGVQLEARIIPFRGEYYELIPERRNLVKNLIYPVPDPQFPFLGVHFTRMMGGSIHAGPNAVLSLKREGYGRASFNVRDSWDTISYGGFWKLAAKHARYGLSEMHRSLSKRAFVHSLQKLIPEVNAADLTVAEAGVRAQALRPDGNLVDDFLIVNRGKTLHVCNAPSPAATSSFEIARYIVDQAIGS